MPTLYKPKKQNDSNEKRKERQNIYQTARWKDLRKSYLMEHPLCEICLNNGITEPFEPKTLPKRVVMNLVHELSSCVNLSNND